jgi:hypothetical protein
MKKTYILLFLLCAITIIGCDIDECPKCHECECVCPKVGTDNDECPVCHECECVCSAFGNVNDTTVMPSGQIDYISDTLKSGSWSIKYFLEDGEVETSDFYGNSFIFSDSGIVSVSIPGSATNITGNWRLKSDSGREELYLVFTQPGKFKELNDDWDVIEWTNEIIRLEELCDDDMGIIDYLTFSKN